MCRVSQLKLSCGPSNDQPHHRRVDELQNLVHETGTHLMPCISRLGRCKSCDKLEIDEKLPPGSLKDSVCTYCAVVQPAWDEALERFLNSTRQMMKRHWMEIRDSYRDPDHAIHDEPEPMRHKAEEICGEALMAVVMYIESQRCIDDNNIPGSTSGTGSSPVLSLASTHTSAEEKDVDMTDPEQDDKDEMADLDFPKLLMMASGKSHRSERALLSPPHSLSPKLTFSSPEPLPEAQQPLPPLAPLKASDSRLEHTFKVPETPGRAAPIQVDRIGGIGVRSDGRPYTSRLTRCDKLRSLGYELTQKQEAIIQSAEQRKAQLRSRR